MTDTAWLEAFKAEHGFYPWEDPNLAAKGFTPEDAYAEHLYARSLSESPKFPGWEKSWQRRYGMTDQEKPYLRPATVPNMQARVVQSMAQRGTPPNPAPMLSPEQMASPDYMGYMGTQETIPPIPTMDIYGMTGDTGPGYIPGMQEGLGASADMGYEGVPTPMFEETPSLSRSVMGGEATAPTWAEQDPVRATFDSLPPQIQEEFVTAMRTRQPLSPVAREAMALMAQKNGMSLNNYVNAVAASIGGQ